MSPNTGYFFITKPQLKDCLSRKLRIGNKYIFFDKAVGECRKRPENRHIISSRYRAAGLEIYMCTVCVLNKLNENRVFQKQKWLKYTICLVYSPCERG